MIGNEESQIIYWAKCNDKDISRTDSRNEKNAVMKKNRKKHDEHCRDLKINKILNVMWHNQNTFTTTFT